MKASNYRGSRKLILDSIKNEKIINPTKFVLRAPKKSDAPSQTPLKLQQQLHEQLSNKFRQSFYQKETRQDSDNTQPIQQYLQARDRRTIVKYAFKEKHFDINKEKQYIQQWLGQMHFKVVSASFNLYLSNQLTFQQVKVHCCQNLLLNILNFLQSLTPNSDNSYYSSRIQVQGVNHHEMTKIMKHINETLVKNLQYMQIKYPLTKDSKPNKSLQSLLTKVNNLGNDEHDIVMKSKVQFQIKQKGNYTSEIMKLINFLISKQGQLCGIKGSNNKQLNYFQYFYQIMEKIFTSIYKPQSEKATDPESFIQAQQQLKKDSQQKAELPKKQDGKKNRAEQTETKEQKQYKQKVLKYTHFQIGKKISSNTQLYTEKEMQTQIFDVRNSSILRILTKWTEELQKKILTAQQQILKRPYRFKRNQQGKALDLNKQESIKNSIQKRQYKQMHKQFSKLNSNQKNDLYQEAHRKAKQVNSFKEQLTQSYNQIESMLSSHLRQGPEFRHIPKNQYKIGFFCSKIQAAASSTLLSYLNKIIHILLLIPAQLRKRHAHDEEYMQNININLITFKISDLFRCKIKSRQAQIIRIFKEIKEMSEKGDIFKIVRIKDRLNQGTRDIMINILFKEIFLCEIQLAIEEYVQTKQLSYDSFSHFLYQMHRSRLGPIMESACTWAQFDQRVKIFRDINDSSKQIKNNVKHQCDEQLFVTNHYPFVCTLCQKFYSTQVGLIQHKKCLQCKGNYECSVCIYKKMTEKEILDFLNLDNILKDFSNDFRLWSYDEQPNKQQKHRNFPQFGLIISKHMKRPEIIFFQTIVFKYDAYIINIKYNEEEREAQIVIIEKIYGNSQKKIKQISQRYIIFEWKEEKAINKRLMPQSMVEQMAAQKKQREQAADKKKKQKEEKKKQLEKKRREEQQKLGRFFKKQKEEEKKQQKEECKSEKSEENEACDQPIKQKKYNYNYNIFQANPNVEVRIMQKQKEDIIQVLLLGVFLKEYDLRNKLKKMNNQDILQRLSKQKIEVLFMQDEFIDNEINRADNLTSIQVQQLKQTFQRVSEVYFDNNRIEDLDFIELMKNLKVAHFSNNKIRSMTSFYNLNELTEIILQNNQIQNVDCIRNMNHLTDLNLNRNQIYQLSFFAQIQEGELSSLVNLHLNCNTLTQMKGLQKLVNLVKLDLSFNQITQIQPITTLLNLKQLDLSSNRITKMKGVSSFANLRKLSLNKNLLKVISKEIISFKHLTYLNLSDNKIRKIQNVNTGNFSKTLKVLNLSQNRIEAMMGLQNLQKLEELYLNDNQIQSVNENYLELVNLTILDLSFNSIQQLNLNVKQLKVDLQKLRIFNISSNILNDTQQNRANLKLINEIFQYNYVMFK